MKNKVNLGEKEFSMVWPLTLIGFPISVLLFLMMGSVYDSGNVSYWFDLFSKILIFSSMVFAFFNFVFCLYSSIFVIRYRSATFGFFSLFFSIISVGLASYFLLSFWREKNVNIFSLKKKSFSDVFSVLFYFLMIIVVSLSFFVVGTDLRK